MFYDDALTASRELEITLTGKNCGQEERAPMCGVPYHAVDVYLNKLVAKGYKVAICEQAEDPKQAKGIVKREVIRIVTPGTNLSQQALDEGRNNYLMCLVYDNNQFGLAITDISTGDFYTTEVETLKELYDEIHRFSPSEIICNDSFYMSGANLDDFKDRLHVSVSTLDTWYMDEAVSVQKIKEHFKVASLDGLGLTDFPSGTLAVGALLLYLYETQKNTLDNLTKITPYRSGGYMIIDSATNRNLELIETLREKQKKGSLLWVLDKTKTAMGARLMRNWIEQPLIENLERLVTRISYRTANPRDLIAFKTSLGMIPPIKQLLSQAKCAELKEIDAHMDCLEDIYALIEKSIQEEPPIIIREGGIIKEGYNADVDKFRLSRTEGKKWLAELESREKEKTGIKNLRVRYNKVFGYYLEVTNSYKELVPEDWTRKQTLANAERYITPELKELEDMILGAEDKLAALEYDLYCEVRDSIGEQVVRIQETAKAIAHLDVLLMEYSGTVITPSPGSSGDRPAQPPPCRKRHVEASLACVAQSNDYVRPSINTKGVIDIQGGRHPVVEKMNNNQMFIDNDTYLDNKTTAFPLLPDRIWQVSLHICASLH